MTSQDDLFAGERADRRFDAAPLAARMRPRSLEEVGGQSHLVAAGTAFRSLLESGRPTSLILWGPAGTGKTTLARLTAKAAEARFIELSATSAGVKDVRAVLAGARQRLEDGTGRTVLFLDEIHRFSKSQQDALLPGVEDGTIILVGATTENPFFEVNSPLISRCTIFRTEALEPEPRGHPEDHLGVDAPSHHGRCRTEHHETEEDDPADHQTSIETRCPCHGSGRRCGGEDGAEHETHPKNPSQSAAVGNPRRDAGGRGRPRHNLDSGRE